MTAPLREAETKLIAGGLAALLFDTHNMIVTCPDPEHYKTQVNTYKQKYVDIVVLMVSMGMDKSGHVTDAQVDQASSYRRAFKVDHNGRGTT